MTDVQKLALLHRLALFIRDPALFEAGIALAERSAAVPSARVLGLSVALTQVNPRLGFQNPGAARPFESPLSEICGEATFLPFDATDYWVDEGTPKGAEARLRSVAELLRRNERLMIRRFARCVLLVLPDPDEPSSEIPDWAEP